jgi:hypothetical protein
MRIAPSGFLPAGHLFTLYLLFSLALVFHTGRMRRPWLGLLTFGLVRHETLQASERHWAVFDVTQGELYSRAVVNPIAANIGCVFVQAF